MKRYPLSDNINTMRGIKCRINIKSAINSQQIMPLEDRRFPAYKCENLSRLQYSILLLIKNAKHFSIRSSYADRNKPIYTESEKDYKLYKAVPLGITQSKQICSSKSAKNEYNL
jgi:hypothetical protein